MIRQIKSRYGRVRAVTLKTVKNGKISFLNRPIEKLYPLEVRSAETLDVEGIINEANFEINDECDDEQISTERPRRVAADNSIIIRRLLGQS